MGYDVSYHPIDQTFLTDTVLQIVLDRMDPTDTYAEAARVAKNRYIANQWGLALVGKHNDLFMQNLDEPKGILSRLFSFLAPEPFTPTPLFESDLHVWGRPFLIHVDDSSTVSSFIDRYIQATPEQVTEIAKDAIQACYPKDADAITVSIEDEMPSDNDFIEDVSWKLELFKTAVKNLKTGKKVQIPQGELCDPKELLENHYQLYTLEFASIFRPGWMARGYVWPTILLEEAKLDFPLIEPSDVPFRQLEAELPSINLRHDKSIRENYMTGGYVSPANVPAFKQFLSDNYRRLIEPAEADDWGEYCELCLKKIMEALCDAEKRELGFIEATEVYSGPLGSLC